MFRFDIILLKEFMDRINAIKNNPLFSCIEELDEYVRQRRIYVKKYAKGETIFHRGDRCLMLSSVQSGRLIAHSLSENGSAMTMFKFKSGSIVGANLLFAQNNMYPLNIYCVTDCELVHIDKETVSELLHNYDFAIQYIKSISRNSEGQNQKINMFFQKTLRENIMHYLELQSVVQRSNKIVLPITKKELAEHLGVQRPSLFIELKKMKEEHVIDIQNRTITLL